MRLYLLGINIRNQVQFTGQARKSHVNLSYWCNMLNLKFAIINFAIGLLKVITTSILGEKVRALECNRDNCWDDDDD